MTGSRQAIRCKAHRTDGQPCTAYAVNGATVCAIHGGRSPQVKAAAERRLLEERAQRELVRFSDAAPVGNPLAELLKLAGEAAAWRQACERRVQALQEVRYESAQRLEQLRAEVGMYERAQRFCLDVNAAVTRLDIDERLARVKEAVAQMLSAASPAPWPVLAWIECDVTNTSFSD